MENISQYSSLLRRIAHALRLRGPLADDATARVLHVVLLSTLCWLLYAFAFGAPSSAKPLANFIQDGFLAILTITALALLYRGAHRAASIIYLLGFWLAVTPIVFLGGGIRSPENIFYIVLPISAAWLLGRNAALVTAAVCLAVSLAMAIWDFRGLPMPLYFTGKPIALWSGMLAAMVIAAVPVAQVLKILREALARSRTDQEALQVKQQHLEALVQERTAAEALLADRNARLQESEHSLCQLTGQLITAQEDERKRIARELHDDLNQQVADLGISLSNVKRGLPFALENMRSEISSVQDRLLTLSDGLRHISHELHPGMLELFGLVTALKSHCEEFSAVTYIPVEFESDCTEPIPPDAALCVYRVAQEALRNAAKHSRATKVRVSLTRPGDLIQLTVSDDGIGFDVHEAHVYGGLGLRSMEERVRLVHGNIELTTQPGRGTTLIVTIELNKADNVSPSVRAMTGSA